MAQITVTFELTTKTAEALRLFADALDEKEKPVKSAPKDEIPAKAEASAKPAKKQKPEPETSLELDPEIEPDEDEDEEPEITLADVREIAQKLSKAGKSQKLKAMFADKFGVNKLTEIPESDYPELMTALKAIK